jgi:SAM-dependent methyltransferase
MNFRKLRTKQVLKYLPQEIGSICDIGCGKEMVFLSGISAKEKVGIDKIGRGIIQNLEITPELKFENKFDFMTMMAVIEHLENPARVLQEIYKALKPGGKIIITTPSRRAKYVLEFLAFFHIINSVKDHKHYFSIKELEELLSDIGFKNIEYNYFSLGFNQIIVGQKAVFKAGQ